MNQHAYTPLLWRVGVFVLLFAALSSVLGLKIIYGGILYAYYFDVYGSLGKALLFGLVAFGLLAYRRLTEVPMQPWQPRELWWLVGAGASFVYVLFAVGRLADGTSGAYWPVTAHVALLASVALVALGCFGWGNVRLFTHKFKKELVQSAALAAGFLAFLLGLYALWEVLSNGVLYVVHWSLAATGLPNEIVHPRTLVFDRFGIEIAKYCSGIESIALFTGLYAVVGIIDWRRFNHRRYLLAFVPALLFLFVCNILRVVALVIVAYFVSERLAFNLFHTYVGMVIFIVYSAVFWRFAYGWMLKRRGDSGARQSPKIS